MIIGRAGFFRELPHGLPDGDSLREAVSGGEGQDEEKLLNYLRGNTVLAATAAMVDDVLDPQETAVAPLELVTDGAWVWPRDLAYYLERYHVALPLQFLLQIELHNWVQPQLTAQDLEQVEAAFLNPRDFSAEGAVR
jgi:hypothetical protein